MGDSLKVKALSLLLVLSVLLMIFEYRERVPRNRAAADYAQSKDPGGSAFLPNGVRVLGHVTSATGQPVFGAMIFHQNPDGNWQRLAQPTDSHGEFTLQLRKPGIHRFYAREGGRLSFVRMGDLANVALAPDQVANVVVNLTMHEALSWRIHVKDIESGQGIEGAEISLPRLFGASRFTDQQGDAELVLSQDVWELQLQADGYQPQTLRLGPQSSPNGEIDLLMEKGCEISGKVVDDQESALEGATLTLTHGEWSQRMQTEAGGKFRITGVPQGQVTLRVSHSGYTTQHVVDHIWPARSQGLVFTLRRDSRPPSQIEGRVQDLFAKPLPGARLTFIDGPQRDIFESTADADGRFTMVVPSLNPERVYRLMVRAEGQAARIMPFQSGPGKVNLVAVLDRGKSISGLVQNEEGDPIAGAALETALERDGMELPLPVALSDTQGRYFIDGVEGGVGVRVTAPGYLSKTVRTEVREGDELNVSLERQGWLIGQVRDAKTRLPVRQFKLRLENTETEGSADLWRTDLPARCVVFSSVDGSFLMPGPGVGAACRVRVMAPGYPTKLVTLTSRADVEADADLVALDDLGRTVKGRVTSKAGRLAGVKVTALVLKERRDTLFPWDAFMQGVPHPDFRERRTTKTDSAGQFRLEGLPTIGLIALVFEAQGHGLALEMLSAAPGQEGGEQTLAVTLEREGRIASSFTRKRHPEAVMLELRGLNAPQLQRRILLGPNADRFVFEKLPEGPYYLDLTTFDEQGGRQVLSSRFIDATKGQILKVNLDTLPAYRVSGQVSFSGSEGAGARVVLMPSDKKNALLRTVADDRGAFLFEYVPQGDYELVGFTADPLHPGDVQNMLEEHPNRLNVVVDSDLELSPRFTATSAIRGCAGANALNWEIEIQGNDERGQSVFRNAIPQGTGDFAVYHLPAGKYSVQAQLGNDTLMLKPLVLVGRSQTLDLGQLSYQDPGKLVVQVAGAEETKGAIQIQVFPQNERAPALSERIWSPGSKELILGGLSPTPVTVRASLHNEAVVLWPGLQDCRILPGKTSTLSVRAVPVTRLKVFYGQLDEVRDVRLVHVETGNVLRCQWRDNLQFFPKDLAVATYFNGYGAVADNLDSGTWQIEVSFISGATKISRAQLVPGVVTQVEM